MRSKYSPTRHFYGTSTAASECGQSLSGSRVSLDSRASSTYSLQLPPSPSLYQRNNNNNSKHSNNNKSNNNLYGSSGSSTVGRAAGLSFLRNASKCLALSLRIPKESPGILVKRISPDP